jgi:hypothetical protein
VISAGHTGQGSKPERNWEIWNRHAVRGETLTDLAKEFGISSGRAGQIFHTCDRFVNNMIRKDLFPGATTKLRDEVLGVEFVFSYEDHVPADVNGNRCYIDYKTDPPVYCWVKKGGS